MPSLITLGSKQDAQEAAGEHSEAEVECSLKGISTDAIRDREIVQTQFLGLFWLVNILLKRHYNQISI